MQGTKHFGLRFEHGGNFSTIVGSGDTDWATVKDTRKSMVCGVIRIDDKQLMSFVRTQNMQAHSSGEAALWRSYQRSRATLEVPNVCLVGISDENGARGR